MITYPTNNQKNTSGIYVIRNLINGKIYIGQTKDAHQRILAHLSLSRLANKDSQPIHKAIKKYGHENFVFFMLIDDPGITREELNSLEIQTIQHFKENGFVLYNVADGGLAGDLGAKVRQKISKKLKGRVFTKEWREKISKALKGKKRSQELVEKSKKTYKERLKKGLYKNKGPNKPPKILKHPEKSRPAWNKGLTKETDERVAKYTISLNKYYKKRKQNDPQKR